jgi:hypothetical protein
MGRRNRRRTSSGTYVYGLTSKASRHLAVAGRADAIVGKVVQLSIAGRYRANVMIAVGRARVLPATVELQDDSARPIVLARLASLHASCHPRGVAPPSFAFGQF